MNDLISKSALLQEFEKETNKHRGNDLWHFTGIKAFIENAPTIEATPVVHGEWITFRGMHVNFYRCSNCGDYYSVKTAFCCSCGAKMDGKETE